jgi:hypothetical protein
MSLYNEKSSPAIPVSGSLTKTKAYRDAIAQLVRLATSVPVDVLVADNDARFFFDIGSDAEALFEKKFPRAYERFTDARRAYWRRQDIERRKAAARRAATTRAAKRAMAAARSVEQSTA